MESEMPGAPLTDEEDLRAKAIKRIKRKRDFLGHVVLFLVINVGLWVRAFRGVRWSPLWLLGGLLFGGGALASPQRPPLRREHTQARDILSNRGRGAPRTEGRPWRAS